MMLRTESDGAVGAETLSDTWKELWRRFFFVYEVGIQGVVKVRMRCRVEHWSCRFKSMG